MKNITNKSILLFFIFSIIFALSCAHVKEQTIKSEGAKYNFVVISDFTAFKEKIYQQLIEKYKSQANIDLLDINKYKDINPKNYNVILIMDTCVAGKPSSDAFTTFANNLEDKSKVILFVSSGSSTWKYSSSGVDAITSASSMENVNNIVAEIAKKIDQIISEK